MISILSTACTASGEPDHLSSVLHQRRWTLVGAYVLLIFGCVPLVASAVVAVVESAYLLMTPLPLTGLPFVLFGWYVRRICREQWGQVEVDHSGIRWQRGEADVGSWSLEEVRRVRRSIAWNHSYRFELGQEYILLAEMVDGTQVRLAIGYAAELEPIERMLAELGVTC